MNSVCATVVWLLLVSPMPASCRLWYVSQTGHDDHGCGGELTPCQTIHFTIGRSTWHDIISIDTTKGAYTNESHSNHIHITHTLTLTPTDGKGRVIIDCQAPENSSLFYVHQASTTADAKIPVLTLTGIVVRNCRQYSLLDDGTIMIENAYVKIVDCEFVSNGVLLFHPWQADTTCKSMQLYIANSSFTSNQLSKPIRAGITVSSCTTVEIVIENVIFNTTPINIDDVGNLSINFRQVTFDGGNTKTAALYLNLAEATNEISLSNCTVRDHIHGKNSAIVIAANHNATQTPKIHMKHVTFVNNNIAKTMGSALSVYARFRHDNPVCIGLKLINCQFVNNSALYEGGAIYVENVCDIHVSGCVFMNNTGITGGAIYIISGSTIVFTNTTFHSNHAAHLTDTNYMTLGGAIYASGAQLSINNCRFIKNSAKFSAQALYIIGAPYLVIQQSYFKDSSDYHASPENTIVFIDSQSDSSYRMDADTQLTSNVFNMTETTQCTSIMNVKARVTEKGNNLWCPHGHHVEMQNIKSPFHAQYVYAHALYWCRVCPSDTYSLHRGHLCSNNTPNYDVCLPCPQKGYCENGRITARANHWGYVDKDFQLQFSVCPQGMCCGQEHCDTFRTCAANRRGLLCGSCVRRHAVTLHTRACVPENSCTRFSYTILVVVIFAIAYVLALLALQVTGPPTSRQVQNLTSWLSSIACLCCKKRHQAGDCLSILDTDDNDMEGVSQNDGTESREAAEMFTRKHHTVNVESALKIIFQFYQLLPVIYQISDVNDVRHSITQTLTDIFCLRPPFTVLRTFCLPPQLGNSGVLMVHLLSSALPMVIISLVYCVVYVSLCIYRSLRHSETDDDRPQKVLKWNSTGLFLYILLFTYIPLLTAVLGLLQCIDVGNEQVLYIDTSVMCTQPWQVVLTVFLVSTLVLQCLVFAVGRLLLRREEIPVWQFILATFLPLPMLLLWGYKLYSKSRDCSATYTTDQITLEHVRRVIDIAETPFGKHCLWWQSALLFHAICIVGLSEFFSAEPVMRALMLIIACILALAIHTTWQPFVSTTANRAECVVLGTLAVFSVFSLHRAVLYSLGLVPIGSNATLFHVYDSSYLIVSLWLPLIVGFCLLLVVTRKLVCVIRGCLGRWYR